MQSARFCFYPIWLLAAIVLIGSCNMQGVKEADHPGFIDSIVAKAVSCRAANWQGSIRYIDSAVASLPAMGPGDKYAVYHFKHDLYAEKHTDTAKAMLYADSMVHVLQPLAGKKEYNLPYAYAHLARGDMLLKKKQYNKAYLDYYNAKAALLPGDTKGKPLFLFEYNNRLADICYGKRFFNKSVFWHKKALEEIRKDTTGDDYYKIQGCIDNIALSYTLAGNLDSAEVYYDQALGLINAFLPRDSSQVHDKLLALGVVLGNRGTVYYREGKYDLAESDYKADISINSKPGFANEDALITRIKLADLYTHTNRLKEAGAVMQEIAATKDTLTGSMDKLQLLRLKADYEKASGNYAAADEFFEAYIQKMSALQAAQNGLMSADFSTEFEVLRHRYDLAALKKQYQLNAIFLVGAVIICVMMVVIVYLVYKNSLREKKSVSELSQRYSQLEMTLAALERSSQQNAHYQRVLAHDLNNPIAAIHSISLLMSDDEGRSDDDKAMLELLRTSSKNAITLIRDQLITRNNPDAEKQSPTIVDVPELLLECLSLLQYRAEEKQQRIVMEPGTGACFVLAYREGLWRVINNLIVNAIKFSETEQLILVAYERKHGEILISVRDNGIGIPDDLKDKLFHLSSDTKRQGTAGEASFGIGLFTSRQIVEEYGGKIWMEDNSPKGAVFYITLPEVLG